MAIEPKEPLSQLAVPPQTWTKHLKFPDPKDIRIYDDTLRDGEQMPGVAFSPEQKLELAKLLSDIGIHCMDVAFPISSDSDCRAIQMIVQAQKKGEIRPEVEILAMCRAVKGDIDKVAQVVSQIGAKPDDVSVLVLSTLSDLHLKYKLGKTLLKREGRAESEWMDLPISFYRDANIKLITEGIAHAKRAGISRVEFAAEDASRGDINYAVEWARACVKAGGTRMCFSDTCGVFTPEAVDHYIPPVIEALKGSGVPMTAHFHNDFGLAALNTVRAMSHGATYPSVTANGIGERAGNAPLHTVVMILKELYGVVIPGFKYDKLTDLRRAVEKYSGIPMQPHEPIIGEGVFSHESGIHTAGIMIHPAIYQFIREGEVGGVHRFVFGKHSGAAAVEAVLTKHQARLTQEHLEITPDLVKQALELVKVKREAMIQEGNTQSFMDEYYRRYNVLGISEERLIELLVSSHSKA